MVNFVAIKVHYDHREQLPKHLKYSIPPTKQEYDQYLDLYATGVGGEGFHECMNFAVPEHGDVPLYLPPTCIPAEKLFAEEFVFFTFTYKEDKELPASIIGVHAHAKLVDLEGIFRTDVSLDFLEVDLLYHAVAKPEFVTLFTIPISYDYKAGIHSPAFTSWGFGLRYLDAQHAKRIVVDAFQAAVVALNNLRNTEALVTYRQLRVLSNIHLRYFGSTLQLPTQPLHLPATNQPEPDSEIGSLGERVVYEAELDYARKNGIPLNHVEWISQAEPTSVYDIRSARLENGKIVEHYIEVKSSRMAIGENIVVSGRQIEFLDCNKSTASVVLVCFLGSQPQVVYHAAGDFLETFEFIPLKFKAVPKE